MKRRIAGEVISFLFVVLFVYAACSKLMDMGSFRVQMGQSPLLARFAHWLVWIVPLMEMFISLMLLFNGYRLIALYLSFSLMLIFSFYIIAILNYGDFIPCSCGGILESMGWTEHLVFNLIFASLAAVGIIYSPQQQIDTVMHQ